MFVEFLIALVVCVGFSIAYSAFREYYKTSELAKELSKSLIQAHMDFAYQVSEALNKDIVIFTTKKVDLKPTEVVTATGTFRLQVDERGVHYFLSKSLSCLKHPLDFFDLCENLGCRYSRLNRIEGSIILVNRSSYEELLYCDY